MIDMGMGEDDGVDGIGGHRKRLPVPLPKLLLPLEEAAVEEHPAAIDLEEMPRAGNHPRRAEEP
jgi:hypothetical protein